MRDRPVHSLPVARSLLLLVALAVVGLLLIFLPGRKQSSEPQLIGGSDQWVVIGSAGLTKGGFNQPRGITGLPDGGFFVADRSARMQRFDAKGNAVELWVMKERKLGNPKGLTVLPNGHLLVCDTHYARLLEMKLNGDVVKQWGGPGMEPGQFALPQSVAVDVERQVVYAVEYGGWTNNRVHKFKLDGSFVQSWGAYGDEPGQFRRACGIALDRKGDVYVSDSANHRIQKFSPDGTHILTFGGMGDSPGNLKYPYDIACAPDQKLYIAEYGNHRISVFDTDGKYVRSLGQPGTEEPGQFYTPWSLTVDSFGRLLVSDTGNHRIQIIKVCRVEGDPETVAQK